jgi:hypothetical protein
MKSAEASTPDRRHGRGSVADDLRTPLTVMLEHGLRKIERTACVASVPGGF